MTAPHPTDANNASVEWGTRIFPELASSARTATTAASTTAATTPSTTCSATRSLARISRRTLRLRLARCAGLRMFFGVEVRLGAVILTLDIRAVALFKLIVALDHDGRSIARRLR
jgi:hypothetical protein